jgi:hypothetical protein
MGHRLPIAALTAAQLVEEALRWESGLLGWLVSMLFWSSFSPWSRRRTLAGDAVVEERRIDRDLP